MTANNSADAEDRAEVIANAVSRLTPEQRALCTPVSEWGKGRKTRAPGPFACLVCDKAYSGVSALARHVKAVHS